MLNIQATFSGFSVDDINIAKEFYGNVLGFELEDKVGGTNIHLANGASAWMYQKEGHIPADYTMLDLVVGDIDEAYETLIKSGVEFIQYPGSPQDEKGIMRGKEKSMGPNIAWFKDTAGNTLAILEN
jgi:catechol 2,3-dioxygenase-like lactoylglutathione lyase family enzyme